MLAAALQRTPSDAVMLTERYGVYGPAPLLGCFARCNVGSADEFAHSRAAHLAATTHFLPRRVEEPEILVYFVCFFACLCVCVCMVLLYCTFVRAAYTKRVRNGAALCECVCISTFLVRCEFRVARRLVSM